MLCRRVTASTIFAALPAGMYARLPIDHALAATTVNSDLERWPFRM